MRVSGQAACKQAWEGLTFDEGADGHDPALVLQDVLRKGADSSPNGPVGVALHWSQRLSGLIRDTLSGLVSIVIAWQCQGLPLQHELP